MSHLIRILFALQIAILFVAGCAVDEDATDTELVSDDVADPAAAEAADVPEAALDVAADDSDRVGTNAFCTATRLNNRATFATCRNHCLNRGRSVPRFDDRTKICRCCDVGTR